MKLIAAGSGIPAMAKELYLAPSTVKTYVQRLYENSASVTGPQPSPRQCAASSWSSVARPVQ